MRTGGVADASVATVTTAGRSQLGMLPIMTVAGAGTATVTRVRLLALQALPLLVGERAVEFLEWQADAEQRVVHRPDALLHRLEPLCHRHRRCG